MIYPRQQTIGTKYIGRTKRLFEMLLYLKDWRTAFDVAAHFNIHVHTARRSFDALQQIGFIIEMDSKGMRTRYRVKNIAAFFGL